MVIGGATTTTTTTYNKDTMEIQFEYEDNRNKESCKIVNGPEVGKQLCNLKVTSTERYVQLRKELANSLELNNGWNADLYHDSIEDVLDYLECLSKYEPLQVQTTFENLVTSKQIPPFVEHNKEKEACMEGSVRMLFAIVHKYMVKNVEVFNMCCVAKLRMFLVAVMLSTGDPMTTTKQFTSTAKMYAMNWFRTFFDGQVSLTKFKTKCCSQTQKVNKAVKFDLDVVNDVLGSVNLTALTVEQGELCNKLNDLYVTEQFEKNVMKRDEATEKWKKKESDERKRKAVSSAESGGEVILGATMESDGEVIQQTVTTSSQGRNKSRHKRQCLAIGMQRLNIQSSTRELFAWTLHCCVLKLTVCYVSQRPLALTSIKSRLLTLLRTLQVVWKCCSRK